MTTISAFDIATRLTGWCSGDGASLPAVGCFEFGHVGDDIGRLLDLWDAYLVGHFNTYKPEAVIYEAPILVVGSRKGGHASRTDKPEVIRKIYSMGGYLELFCRRRGVPCFEVTLQDVKKAVTNNARADKSDVVAVARRVGLQLPAKGYEDAADAFGAWLNGIRSYSPELSRKWDSVVFSPQGRWTA